MASYDIFDAGTLSKSIFQKLKSLFDSKVNTTDIPEVIGDVSAVDPTTQTDPVSVYYTKEEVNTLVNSHTQDMSDYYTKSETDTAIKNNKPDLSEYYTKSELLNAIYPVGAIYISANNVNPATLFGGTWEQIKDEFLLASGDTYVAGTTGGTAEHSHKYGIAVGCYYSSMAMEFDTHSGVLKDGDGDPAGLDSTSFASFDTQINNNATTSTKKVNASHYKSVSNTSIESNLPPYLAVYVWKRTA